MKMCAEEEGQEIGIKDTMFQKEETNKKGQVEQKKKLAKVNR
jgi:hypothetical protein